MYYVYIWLHARVVCVPTFSYGITARVRRRACATLCGGQLKTHIQTPTGAVAALFPPVRRA